MKWLTKMFQVVLSNNQSGFTLIELLVVVGILGVLGSVVTLNVGKFIGSGHDETACTEKHNVQTAVLAYMAENSGSAPSNVDACSEYYVGTPSGTYTVASDGEVIQTTFNGGAACIN